MKEEKKILQKGGPHRESLNKIGLLEGTYFDVPGQWVIFSPLIEEGEEKE